MGKSGKSDKKVKSERLNALRKQYDSFLEEDKKRRQRNEYILGRLDKMRTCDKLVVRYREPVSIKADHPVLLNNRSGRNDSELQPFRRNYCVEPPAKSVEELDLLRVISKNYILIPKRDQRSDDLREFTPENNTPDQDNDWKSKYDILNQLKKREKEPTDHVVQSTEINNRGRNSKYDAEYLTADKQSDVLSLDGRSPVTSLDPDIPEREFANNVQFGNDENYPDYKQLLKPVEQIAINVIDDSEPYSNHVYDTSTIKNLNQAYRPVTNETFEEPQAYIESNAVQDKESKENCVQESETHALETTTSENCMADLDQTIPEVKQSKEIINQNFPLFKEDQQYRTEVADREDLTPSEVAHVEQDVVLHSPDLEAVDENSVQNEYNQEQLQYTPEFTAMTDSVQAPKLGTETVQQDQEDNKLVYPQETNENYQVYDQHDGADNYTAAQVDDTQNYDQIAQEVAYDRIAPDVNYDQNVQVVNYDQNSQNVNYDNHAVLAQGDALNYEQAPNDVAYDRNEQNANYEQTLQDQTYEGDAQQNYADDPTYAHTENYPDQSQPVGEHYDQDYPVDGVYQPDTSYAADQVFTHGVDQNYANVQNEPVAYDHDITQQQYDQTYAEQYNTEEQPQVAYEQPDQYQQEYDQAYNQHQQDEQNALEGVQQQLDTEDGFVEQSSVAEGNANEGVPEETVPITTT